ncbi:actin-like ATPase domain-containing protein [Cylindrobasidium torrendii FP15055 ss-10]|uniref:Actin-like ATPase domain-containing protein n=1 Tax=Cylindrobasidium torrendii FP15055 ss-10 TaxID=1314674 RepID=A0A0D7AXD9_9AGAR|nr:actin-like ATPase domain-containing protein [Cylindrobasidium torrendii FP15055 ss-10]
MSCCGESKTKASSDAQNRISQVPNPGYVTTQPTPTPGIDLSPKPFNLATPPPAHIGPQHSGGGYFAPPPPGAQSPWNLRPASPPTHAGTPSPRPPSLINGMGSPYGSMNNSMRASMPYPTSPPPISTSPVGSYKSTPVPDDGKLSVSVDFGTTFSGVSYGSSRLAGGVIQQILSWPGSFENFRKIPTCLLYDDVGQVLAWGLEAKNATEMPDMLKCEWFKLFLEPHALRDQSAVDPRLPPLPPGKQAMDLIVDFLSCLWEYAKEQITREIGAVADLNSADVWLTVPAAWDAKGCDIMREAAIAAGMVRSAHAGDKDWRERLHIITEPEAAAVHCAHLTDLHRLRPSQNFIVCDAGGGTVDLAVYKIIGNMAHLEIAEIAARSGANCGSLFLDLRFRELVKTLLEDHPAHLDPASLANFMHSFSESDKLDYRGPVDDDAMFHFTCFNVEDPTDPSVGLIDGQLTIPGNLLRREVFDPVIEQVLEMIEEQTRKVHQRIDALLLVGGFAGSEYLKLRVEERFSSRISVIARPVDADTATLRGAARYGLARRPLVASVIAPRSYIVKVKLPAEPEDWQKRPAYIRTNDAGVHICDNRLQFLVQKGAILRRGQRLTTKFCKFSQGAHDSAFIAVMYTSDSDHLMRYTDEGETTELCKWTVDLSSLPAFQRGAAGGVGFYTEFELGLELDSAEVRGILLYDNQEWGRVTFDFLN